MQWARRGYHFPLLVRVPERPAGFDVALEQAMAMMDRAVGPERMKVLRSQFRVWERCGGEAGIEEWRRRMLARMFCLRRQAVQSGFADIHVAVGQGCQLADLAGRSRAKRFQSRPGSGSAILLDRVQQGASGPRQGGLPGSVGAPQVPGLRKFPVNFCQKTVRSGPRHRSESTGNRSRRRPLPRPRILLTRETSVTKQSAETSPGTAAKRNLGQAVRKGIIATIGMPP